MKNTFLSFDLKRWMSALVLTLGMLVFGATASHAADIIVIDSDGDGSEFVVLIGSDSYDPDGALIDYQWKVNNVVVASGFGPTVANLERLFLVGTSTVSLVVRDDAGVNAVLSVKVIVKAQGSNRRPIASATVPSSVDADVAGVALVAVNASASSDPDGDPIINYKWTEGPTVLAEGASPLAVLTLNGITNHTIRLTVSSRDTDNVVQTGSQDYVVRVDSPSVTLAGRQYRRITGQDFAFSGDPQNYGSYSGITYNPLTGTYFMVEGSASTNPRDLIIEINPDGTLVRVIDIAGLKSPAIPDRADPEGIVWLHSNVFGIALQQSEELVILPLPAGVTTRTRTDATAIYNLFGDPTGLTYNHVEKAFYIASRDTTNRVARAVINGTNLDVTQYDLSTIIPTPEALYEIATFPRVSPNVFVLNRTDKKIIEVNLKGATPVLVRETSFAGFPIPEAEGMTFGPDGKFYIVGQTVSGQPEDDFNVFTPTFPVANATPIPVIRGAWAIDGDGDGKEDVLVRGVDSVDNDGSIINYAWYVNGELVAEGFGPTVGDLNREFSVGDTTVRLVVRDDAQTVAEASSVVTVKPQGSNLPPLAAANVPSVVPADNSDTAMVLVDASLSRDPENDPLTRFRWIEGATTLYDGADAKTTLSVRGVGQHKISLFVYSTDSNGLTQSGDSDFF